MSLVANYYVSVNVTLSLMLSNFFFQQQAAKQFAKEVLGVDEDQAKVISSWGPYTTTSGTAKKTGVAGLTVPAEV